MPALLLPLLNLFIFLALATTSIMGSTTSSAAARTIHPLRPGLLYKLPAPHAFIELQGYLVTPPKNASGGTTAFLVDVVGGPDSNPAPLALLKEQNRQLTHLFLTHRHQVGTSAYKEWQKRFPDLVVVADAREIRQTSTKKGDVGGFDILNEPSSRKTKIVPARTWVPYLSAENYQFSIAGIPGHVSGHLAFLYQSGEEGFLFGGDTMDPASEPFCEDSLPEQVRSMRWMRDFDYGSIQNRSWNKSGDEQDEAAPAPSLVLPTHGTIGPKSGQSFRDDMLERLRGFRHFKEEL